MLDLSSVVTKLTKSLASDTFVKLVRKSETYDPKTGEETPSSETVTNLNAASLPVPSSLVDGTRIRTTDKMAVCDNKIKPLMTDFIRIDNIDYSIVQIIEINHAGVVQGYKVISRG